MDKTGFLFQCTGDFLSGYGDSFLSDHTCVRMLLASTAPYQLLHLSRQNSEIGEQSRIESIAKHQIQKHTIMELP